jgi:HlyD family secretion protein
VDGVVLKRSVDVGQTVAASFQTPELFLIARSLDEMAIHANVSEADVGLIREDQPVRFSVDAHPHMEFEGRVAQFRLHAANAHGVVSYTVVVNVPNAQGLLKPGMTAQTRIVVASRQAALRLPTAALRFRPEEADLLPKGAKAASSAPTGALMTKSASAHGSQDDGALAGLRQGARVYKVYTVGADQVLKAHEVTVGIANTRFTELLPGSTLNAGDALVTRPVKLLAVDHAS